MDSTMFGSGNNRSKKDAAQSNGNPEIREDLVIELDYKTVKKDVWGKFIKIYGGGPQIIREKPYIYSAAVQENTIPASRLRSLSPLVQAKQRK